jgi:hypothetical protein
VEFREYPATAKYWKVVFLTLRNSNNAKNKQLHEEEASFRKLEDPQLVKGFLEIYGSEKLISVGTKARHLFLSFNQINPIQAKSPWKPHFYYSSKVFEVFAFLQFSLQKKIYWCLICHVTATCPANLILLIGPPGKFCEEYNSRSWSWYAVFSSPLLPPSLRPK